MSDDGLVQNLGGLGDGTVPGALYTALSAVAALQYRQRTGQGVYIDGAGSDAVLAQQWYPAVYAWNDARLTDRRGMSQGEEHNPKYHYYETKDRRFVLFCAIEPKFWENFCRAVDRTDLIDSHDREAPVDFGGGDLTLAHELQAIFHQRTQEEWADLALVHDIALGPANQVDDLRQDPQLAARGIIHESRHPVAGPFTAVGWPAMVGGQPFDVTRPAPTLGEHADEVLAELGYDQRQIERLRDSGVVLPRRGTAPMTENGETRPEHDPIAEDQDILTSKEATARLYDVLVATRELIAELERSGAEPERLAEARTRARGLEEAMEHCRTPSSPVW
jgi:crotonobetainyl-CoA:carnitine CoA-transferase CaiB-like acyl-CoA transferase